MEKVDLIPYPEEIILDQRRNAVKTRMYAKCDKCGYIHTADEICLNKKRKPVFLKALIDATEYPFCRVYERFNIIGIENQYLDDEQKYRNIIAESDSAIFFKKRHLTGIEDVFIEKCINKETSSYVDYQPWDVGTLNGREYRYSM